MKDGYTSGSKPVCGSECMSRHVTVALERGGAEAIKLGNTLTGSRVRLQRQV